MLRRLFGVLAGTNPSTNTLIAATVPRSRLGRSLGWLQTVGQLSNTLGPMLGGFMAAVVGLRGAFVAAGLMAVAAGAIAIFGVHELSRPDAEAAPALPNEQSAPIQWRPLLAPLLALVTMILAIQMLSPIMPALVAGVRHQPQSAGPTGITIGLLGLASAAGAVSVGRPERRFGAERTLILGTLLGVLAELVLFAARDWTVLLVALVILGLGQGLVLPMGSAMLAVRSDQSRLGAVFGIASAAQSAGFASGPLLGGTLAAGFGLRALPPAGTLLLLLGVLPILASASSLRFGARPRCSRTR